MNKNLQTTKAFDKDLKRAKKRGKDLKKLKVVIDTLVIGESIPSCFRPHKLSGDWAGYWECHIESDWLLIWIDKNEETVVLTRLGTHSDLFR